MQTVKISGRVYLSRPPSKHGNGEPVRRLRLIVESLKFAASQCSETERRMYKSILEVLAHAENTYDQARGQRLPDPQLSDLQSPAHEL